MHTVKEVIKKYGQVNIAKVCGVTQPAVKKWSDKNKLPRTEWSLETNHAQKIYDAYGVIIDPGFITPANEEDKREIILKMIFMISILNKLLENNSEQ